MSVKASIIDTLDTTGSHYAKALEAIILDIETALRENADGRYSAGDVCAELWDIGLDPEPDTRSSASCQHYIDTGRYLPAGKEVV